MTKRKEDLKILYMQIRSDQETRDEEFDEFVRYSGLFPEQFTIWNVFDTDHFDATGASEYDALFIGGSSDDPDDSPTLDPGRFPFITDAKALIRYCIDENIPTFASCIGYQIAIEVLGGEVVFDREHMEMGTYPIYLTEEGKKDLLLHDTPSGFFAVSGHKKRAAAVPEGCTLLAYSDLCPFHAIRVNGKPFYAFQFHPEIDRTDLLVRLKRYISRYFDDEASKKVVERIVEANHDTNTSNTIVKKFVERVLLV
jgi:GMP synthase (glutamine-hydrolysing)